MKDLLVLDIFAFFYAIIHLQSIDVFFKIIASITIITVNLLVLSQKYLQYKNKKNEIK